MTRDGAYRMNPAIAYSDERVAFRTAAEIFINLPMSA